MNIEEVLSSMAKEVPSLGVLCFIVWIFLKHQKDRDQVIKEIAAENRQAMRESTVAIQENTKAAGVNSEIMRSVAQAMRKVANGIKTTQSESDL